MLELNGTLEIERIDHFEMAEHPDTYCGTEESPLMFSGACQGQKIDSRMTLGSLELILKQAFPDLRSKRKRFRVTFQEVPDEDRLAHPRVYSRH